MNAGQAKANGLTPVTTCLGAVCAGTTFVLCAPCVTVYINEHMVHHKARRPALQPHLPALNDALLLQDMTGSVSFSWPFLGMIASTPFMPAVL